MRSACCQRRRPFARSGRSSHQSAPGRGPRACCRSHLVPLAARQVASPVRTRRSSLRSRAAPTTRRACRWAPTALQSSGSRCQLVNHERQRRRCYLADSHAWDGHTDAPAEGSQIIVGCPQDGEVSQGSRPPFLCRNRTDQVVASIQRRQPLGLLVRHVDRRPGGPRGDSFRPVALAGRFLGQRFISPARSSWRSSACLRLVTSMRRPSVMQLRMSASSSCPVPRSSGSHRQA